MTVGQELAKITPLKLFHNHMTIDLVDHFFDYSTHEGNRLVNRIRQEIFHEVAQSNLYGLIFTFMWAFDLEEDWVYVKKVNDIFLARNAEVYIIELEADYHERIRRNKTPNRLMNKPTKRNVERSEETFIRLENRYRLNSHPGEISADNYLRIDNTHLSARKTAKMIRDYFSL
jgi:hypothetical protein